MPQLFRSGELTGLSKPLRGRFTIFNHYCLIKQLMVSSYRLAGRYLLPDKVKKRKEDTMSHLIKRFKEDLQLQKEAINPMSVPYCVYSVFTISR
jgi:hypothetical protein